MTRDTAAEVALTEAEREAIEDAAGCGCCCSKSAAEKVWPDDCPVDETGFVDHAYLNGCIQVASVSDLVERIIAARLAATATPDQARLAAVEALVNGEYRYVKCSAISAVRAALAEPADRADT